MAPRIWALPLLACVVAPARAALLRLTASSSTAAATGAAQPVSEALQAVPEDVAKLFRGASDASADDVALDRFAVAVRAILKKSLQAADVAEVTCAEGHARSAERLRAAVTQVRLLEERQTGLRQRETLLEAQLTDDQNLVARARGEFAERRGLCTSNAAVAEQLVKVLRADDAKTSEMAAGAAASCAGDRAPQLLECTMPDGTVIVTSAPLRQAIAKLSPAAEQFAALNLWRAAFGRSPKRSLLLQLRGDGTLARALEELPGDAERQLGGAFRGKASTAQAAGDEPSAQEGQLSFLAVDEHLSAAKAARAALRSARRRTFRGDDLCRAVAAPPSCAAYREALSTLGGNVRDLASEAHLRAEREAEACAASLNRMGRQADGARVRGGQVAAMVRNILAELQELAPQLASSRRVARDLRAETSRAERECRRQRAQAERSVCAARTLRKAVEKESGKELGAWEGSCVMGDWVRGPCSRECVPANTADAASAGGGALLPAERAGKQTLTREVIFSGQKLKDAEARPTCPPTRLERSCNAFVCPVDCAMSAYSDWSSCSQSCGGGFQVAYRSVSHPAAHGGMLCGATFKQQQCNTHACDAECQLGDWAQWSACSQGCSVARAGYRVRTRGVGGPARGFGGCAEPTSHHRRQVDECNAAACADEGAALKCASKVDVVFALDVSGSVDSEQAGRAAAFVMSFLNSRAVAGSLVRAGAVLFGDSARTVAVVSEDLAAVAAAVGTELPAAAQGHQLGVGSNGAAALAAAEMMLGEAGRSDAQSVVVMVTDGMPTSKIFMSTMAGRLQDVGVRLMAFALGDAVNARVMSRWVSFPAASNMRFLHGGSKELEKAKTLSDFVVRLCPKVQ